MNSTNRDLLLALEKMSQCVDKFAAEVDKVSAQVDAMTAKLIAQMKRDGYWK